MGHLQDLGIARSAERQMFSARSMRHVREVRDKVVSGPRALELINGFTHMARLRVERSLRDERRAAPRWPLRQPMRLHSDVRAYDVVSADISQCGVGVYCTVLDLPDASLYAIELSPQSLTPALLRARIVRREPDVGGLALYGLAFVIDVAALDQPPP